MEQMRRGELVIRELIARGGNFPLEASTEGADGDGSIVAVA
jgi:hypothetical protein